MEEEQRLFKENNSAFYFSSKFLPPKNRDDIYRLYSFVFTANKYASSKDQHKKLLALEKSYESAIHNPSFETIAHKWDDFDTRIIKHIVHLQNKYKIEKSWINDFFKAKKNDYEGRSPKTLEQSLDHINGSAEVPALIAAKIMNLPDEAHSAVVAEARAIAWIFMIRDIHEASLLGQVNFPLEDLKKFGLVDLSEETARANTAKFNKFIQYQINRYQKWQNEAINSIGLIPERNQVFVRTIIDLSNWIVSKISQNPLIVYEKKVSPRRRRAARQIIKNTARGTARVTVRTSRKVRPATKIAIPKIKQAPSIAKEKAKDLKDKYIEIEE